MLASELTNEQYKLLSSIPAHGLSVMKEGPDTSAADVGYDAWDKLNGSGLVYLASQTNQDDIRCYELSSKGIIFVNKFKAKFPKTKGRRVEFYSIDDRDKKTMIFGVFHQWFVVTVIAVHAEGDYLDVVAIIEDNKGNIHQTWTNNIRFI